MMFSRGQKEALENWVRGGLNEAARSFFSLTGEEIHLKAGKILVMPADELEASLLGMEEGEVIGVQQTFCGAISGKALVVTDYAGALALCEITSKRRIPLCRLDGADREVLLELGSTLLAALLTTFCKALETDLSHSPPRLRIISPKEAVESLKPNAESMFHVLVLTGHMEAKDRAVECHIMIAMEAASMNQLFHTLGK